MSKRPPETAARALVLAIVVAVGTLGCQGQVTDQPPVVVERNMYVQEKYRPQGSSSFFADHGAMRPPVEGTVPLEGYEDDDEIATGLTADQAGYVLAIPARVIERAGGLEAMATRGRDRFDVFCASCHGLTGDGKGMVARAPGGFPAITNLADERICRMPDGQLLATIANGVRNMPAHAAQIPLVDRWAIVAYVRALELHELARRDAAP